METCLTRITSSGQATFENECTGSMNHMDVRQAVVDACTFQQTTFMAKQPLLYIISRSSRVCTLFALMAELFSVRTKKKEKRFRRELKNG